MLEQGSIPAFHHLHHPFMGSCSLALPQSVKSFPLESEESFVSTCRERCVFARLLLTTFFPWSSIQGVPGVCGWGFPQLLLTVRKDKQSQFIFPQLSPFCGQWAFCVGILPLCNSTALYFPRPLFGINPIIFKKKHYLWLLTRMRDANRSFLIWLLSYKEN